MNKARKNKPRVERPTWTDAENQVMRAIYSEGAKQDVLAALPERTWQAILMQATRLGVTRREVWSAQDEEAMRRYYTAEGALGLAKRVPYTVKAIYTKAQRMGLAYDRRRNPGPKPKRVRVYASRALIGPRLPTKAQLRAQEGPKPVRAPKPAREKHKPRKFTPTPNLDAQKALVAKKKANGPRVSVTAEQIRMLPANDPQRHIYAMGGRAAVEAYRLQQAA